MTTRKTRYISAFYKSFVTSKSYYLLYFAVFHNSPHPSPPPFFITSLLCNFSLATLYIAQAITSRRYTYVRYSPHMTMSVSRINLATPFSQSVPKWTQTQLIAICLGLKKPLLLWCDQNGNLQMERNRSTAKRDFA